MNEFLDDVTDNVFASFDNDCANLKTHPFLLDAYKSNCLTESGFTIFLPTDYKCIDDYDDDFEEFFNRHAVRGVVSLGCEGVQRLTTLSKLTIHVYPLDDSTFAVSGVVLDSNTMNSRIDGCYINPIEGASLPQLRPFGHAIASMRMTYLSGEIIELPFEMLGIEDSRHTQTYTLMCSFHARDHSNCGEMQMFPWVGNGTVCRIAVPNVSTRKLLMLWFQLYDNNYRRAIMNMLWPWCITILPNVNMHPNPQIIAINPKRGQANDELWILGKNFQATDLRVSIGSQAAHVFYCDATMIRCFIPSGSDMQPVWVANGNVYTRYDCFQYNDTT